MTVSHKLSSFEIINKKKQVDIKLLLEKMQVFFFVREGVFNRINMVIMF